MIFDCPEAVVFLLIFDLLDIFPDFTYVSRNDDAVALALSRLIRPVLLSDLILRFAISGL